MAISVGRTATNRILDRSDRFALQVTEPSDLTAALEALRQARIDLLALAGGRDAATGHRGPLVSDVVAAPGGPLLLVEGLDVPYDVLRTVPAVVERRLSAAGVASAVIESPAPAGPLDDLDVTPGAAVLRLFPAPGTSVPASWIDVAAEWVVGDLGDFDTVRFRILGVPFDVAVPESTGVLHECRLARAWCDAVSGDLDDRIRTASLTFGRLPHLALAAGGPGTGRSGLLARFALLRDVARDLAPEVAYACVDFEPDFATLGQGLARSAWWADGGAPANTVAAELADEAVPDAFPYQVLGPGHVDRLGDQWGDPLGDDRHEVVIGDPGDWLPDADSRDDAQAEGWDVLAPLLLSPAEADTRRAARPRPVASDGGSPASSAGSAEQLEDVVIDATPHPRRGTHLTVLELAAWLGREPHSDEPASVSPVLATYVRWLGAGLDHDQRQRLRWKAAALVGTAGHPDADRDRRWVAADWLVRTCAPAWLRLAGLPEHAERLQSLEAITSDLELVRAVDVLGTGTVIAARRLEAAATDGAEAAWSAWEEIADSSGWVAAAEAATMDAPADVVSATDLRVIEISRDGRARDALEARRSSLGDATWTAVLHAIGDQAWDAGWAAAEEACWLSSDLSLRDLVARTEPAVVADADQRDAAIERAHRAARDALARAAFTGATGSAHAWDDALAAAGGAGDGAWGGVVDAVHAAVGDEAWRAIAGAAGAAVARVLWDAPELAGRVVAVALARECSGVAARAASAMGEPLDPVAAALREEAIALIDRLVTPATTSFSTR